MNEQSSDKAAETAAAPSGAAAFLPESGGRRIQPHETAAANFAAEVVASGVKSNPFSEILGWLENFVNGLVSGEGTSKDYRPSDFAGVKRNGNHDLLDIIAGAEFSTLTGLACFLAFLALMNLAPAVYTYRAMDEFTKQEHHKGHQMTMPTMWSFISWLQVSRSVTDEQIFSTIGLDALMYLKFFKLCQRLLLFISPVVIFILAPLHFILGSRYKVGDLAFRGQSVAVPIDTFSRFGITTMTSAWELQKRNMTTTFSPDEHFWNGALAYTHACVCLLIVVMSIKSIQQAHKEFLGYRWQWLRAMSPPRATTLLVEGIPPAQRSDKGLHDYFARLFSKGAVQRAYIIRRTWTLRRSVDRVQQLEAKLKETEALAAGDPNAQISAGAFRGQKAAKEVAEQVAGQLTQARVALEQERVQLEAAQAQQKPEASSGSGFVTFTSQRYCRLASREQLKPDANKMKLSLPPEPTDVRYDDLAADELTQSGSSVTAWFLTLCIFCFWVPLTAIIGGFTNLEAVMQLPGFRWLATTSDGFQSFLSGILAQLSLKIVMAILPMLLMIVINTNFLKSGNQAQLRMQERYFAFLVIFVVLVSALNVTLIHTVREIVNDPWAISVILTKLPGSSHFYINYLLLGWFTLSMALIRISPLIKFWLFKAPNQSNTETREWSEPEDQDGDGMGARHAKAAHMMTIAFVFCACSPLIVVVALVWFTVGSYVYRWLMLFSENTKPDLGGAFWVGAVKHTYFSLFMYVMLMLVVLMENPWGRGFPPLIVSLAGVYVLYKWYGFFGIDWETMPFEAVVESEEWQQQHVADGTGTGSLTDADKYIQPELVTADANAALVTSLPSQAAQAKPEQSFQTAGLRVTMTASEQVANGYTAGGASTSASAPAKAADSVVDAEQPETGAASSR